MSSDMYALLALVFALGAVVGAIILFFVAQKNPKWVQDVYEKQKGLTSQVRNVAEEKLAEAQKELADLKLDKLIDEKIIQKIKELGK